MAKFHRDEDDREEPERPRPTGSNVVLVAVLVACGLMVLLCAGIAAVGFYTARSEVREAQMAQAEIAALEEEKDVPALATGEREDVRDFRVKVKHYLSEVRAGAKLMTGAPSVEDARKTASHIRDLQADLPDVPPEIDQNGKVTRKLKGIQVTFASAAENVRLRAGFADLGDNKEADESTKRIAKSVADVNAAADEIEVMVGIKAEP